MSMGGTIVGVKSAVIFLGRVRSKLGYGELCRFTIRGLIRPRLLTHLQAAARAKICLKWRALNRGRAGGKCSREGLGEANQAQVASEGKTSRSYSLTARRMVH